MVLKYYLLFFSLIFTFSCGNVESNLPPNSSVQEIEGEKLYIKTCMPCHGAEGSKGLSGATDLSKSILTKEEVKDVVSNGRKTMAGYKDVYSEKEIEALVAYIQILRK